MINLHLRTILLACSIAFFCSCTENELFELSPNATESSLSYENQFKAIWTAIDINYPIWDYERDEYGLDWDRVYNKYLPYFKELDSIYKETNDTTCWIYAQLAYDLMLKNLHDGHINLKIKDIYSNKNGLLLSKALTTLNYFVSRLDLSVKWNYYQEKDPTGYYLLDQKIASSYRYGHFNNDVIYLYFPNFQFSEIISKPQKSDEDNAIIELWQTWFDKIQEMHKTGDLKGVILDVRSNNGGYTQDYQYFLGALHSGTIQTGRYRMKRSIGRFDYSYPIINGGRDFTFDSYQKQHTNIDVPIIVIADSLSASMAEHTCLAAKQLPNAYVIGTDTYGAFSPIREKEKDQPFTYWGHIGDPQLNTASFYIEMPFAAIVTYEGKIIEGKGVEPDKFIMNDVGGRDKQLEFALDFVEKLNKRSQ